MAGFNDKIMVTIDAASGGAVREMDRLQKSTRDADQSIAGLGKTLKAGLVAGAGAFIGAGIVSFLNDSVTAFVSAQKAADLFSTAMNTSGEYAGKLATYLNSLGVDTNDLIEINAEFGQALQKNGKELDLLGVTLKKNADGSLDTADALVQVIDGLQGVGDGATRSQIALKFFGEEGAKQLAPLIFGTKNLKDTLADLEFVYDPKRAQEYATAQQELDLAFQALQQTIGQALVPAFTNAARFAKDVIDVLSDIPSEVVVVTGAFVGLNVALKSSLATGAFAALATGARAFAASLTIMGGIIPLVTGGIRALTVALVSNPITLVAAALAAVVGIAYAGSQRKKREMEAAVEEVKKLEAEGMSRAEAIRKVAEAEETALRGRKAGDKNSFAGKENRDRINDLTAAVEEAEAAMSSYQAATEQAADTQDAFNSAVEDFANGKGSYDALISSAQAYADSLAAVEAKKRLADKALAVVDVRARIKLRLSDTELQLEAYDLIEKVKEAAEARSKITPLTPQVEVDRINLEAQQAVDLMTLNWEDQLRRGLIPKEQFDLNLENLKLRHPELTPQIEQVQQDVKNGLLTPVDADVTVNPKVKILQGQLKAELDSQFKNPRVIEELSTQLDAELAVTTTNTVSTVYSPDGYEATKARADYLAQDRAGSIAINHTFNPDGYNALKARTDFLAQNRSATITVNVDFEPGSYVDIMNRINTIAKNRSVTITQVVQTVSAGGGGGDDNTGLYRGRTSANMMFSPINMVRVSLDGRELRSVIDDEIRALTPTRQEVA